ncbi:MAG: hypothetical protein HYR91_01370 [Flavobacteriia bacterium]|nr:hypothetical protein [Flavobacteriia bacterium]
MFKNNRYKTRVDAFLKVSTLFFCVFWYVWMYFNNEIPPDSGDGIMHYFLSNASWENPTLFLHHWGKPLFILLSSPFSQFGFGGIVGFNILVFFLSVLVAWKIAAKLEVNKWFQLLFPLILVNIQDFSLTVLGGLTEPLFNFFFLISFWFLMTKQWTFLAIIVSFLPFLRSEGQLPIVLVLMMLLYLKQFKSLPFLILGFIIYALIGYFVNGDFWWYFTKSPYSMNNGIYNQGQWNHYLMSYKNYLGNIGLFIFIGAFIYLAIQSLKKHWLNLEFTLLFYVYGTFVGIVVLHSYFWATGQNASLGLTRITTQAMPAFILLNLYFLSKSKFGTYSYLQPMFGILAVIIAFSSVFTKHFPSKANPFEIQLLRAASDLKSSAKTYTHIFYHHPLFCFAFGDNPFKKNQTCVFYYCEDLEKEIDTQMKNEDLIVRDSQFGPQEQHLTLKKINASKRLKLIKEYVSTQQIEDYYQEKEGVSIYEVQKK